MAHPGAGSNSLELPAANRGPIREAFCRRFPDSGVWTWTTWLETRAAKCPLDLRMYRSKKEDPR